MLIPDVGVLSSQVQFSHMRTSDAIAGAGTWLIDDTSARRTQSANPTRTDDAARLQERGKISTNMTCTHWMNSGHGI